jgi:hypothetical protein
MHCQHIPLPGGGTAILCGGRKRMSKEEIKLQQDTLDRMAVIQKAKARAKEEAESCNRLGHTVWARMWDTVAKILEQDNATQMRIFKGNIPDGFGDSK